MWILSTEYLSQISFCATQFYFKLQSDSDFVRMMRCDVIVSPKTLDGPLNETLHSKILIDVVDFYIF